jgi:hypothetical protein
VNIAYFEAAFKAEEEETVVRVSGDETRARKGRVWGSLEGEQIH